MRLCSTLLICSSIAFALVVTTAAQAAIIDNGGDPGTLRYGYHAGPGGGIDANTVHLWTLDESGTPFLDSGTSANIFSLTSESGTAPEPSRLQATGGATNNARRIGTGATGSQRITAKSGSGSSDNITSDQYNSFFGGDGSFTVDLLIRPDFNPGDYSSGTGLRIFSTESESGEPGASFFSLVWDGDALSFYTQGPSGTLAPVPTALSDPTNPNAFTAAGEWFHVAIAFDGDQSASVYWTKVTDPNVPGNPNKANLLGTFSTAVADPALLPSGLGPDFAIGNETNGTINHSWDGAIDELRISNVARSANEFIFVPEPGSIFLTILGTTGLIGVCYRGRRKVA